MKIHHISILFLLFSLSAFSQNEQLKGLFSKALKYRAHPDSGLYYARQAHLLSRELRFEQGQHLGKMYAGMVYYNIDEVDTAATLLYEALPHLNALSFEKGMAHWYIGKIHGRNRDFKNAEDHYLRAQKSFQETDSLKFLGDVYNSLGIIQGMQTNYNEALNWFTKAYQLKIDNGLEETIAGELNNIALVYMRMGSYTKAIDYVMQAIDIDPANSRSEYSTLGGIYNYMGKPDSALIFYEIALEQSIEQGDKFSQSINLSNLSNIYYQQEKFKSAISLLKKALTLTKENKKSQFSIFVELGKSYRGLKMYDSASYYLRKGYKLAQEQRDKVWADEAVTFLGYLLSEQNKFDSAFYYLSLSLGYRDSLNNDRIQEIFANQRVRLETAKKQNEIEMLEQEKEVDRYKQRSIIAGSIFIFIIGLLSFFNFRSRQIIKQKRLIEENLMLEKELEKNRAELSAHTLNMIHRKNSLEEIESHINNLEGKDKQKIKSIINVNKALEKDWENFKNYFSQVHANFFEKLRDQFPKLSQSEVRLTALIKMNLANHEIATLLNIESKSVRMARYRLRKKLDLSEETDLNLFIHKI